VNRMTLARDRLGDFLEDQHLVAQSDNLFTRFLLCPHPDIPADSLIAPELHDSLYEEALAKLGRFGLVDILENPAMAQNFARWFGAEFQMVTSNVTCPRNEFPLCLSDELTPDIVERLLSLTAIDRRLWIHTARKADAFPDPELQADAIYASYVARQTARFSVPMTLPSQPGPSSYPSGYAASL